MVFYLLYKSILKSDLMNGQALKTVKPITWESLILNMVRPMAGQ